MNNPDVLLDVSDYSVGFRTERGLAQVVDKVSFQIERGKTLGIVGESGSGKSVLNRSLMGSDLKQPPNRIGLRVLRRRSTGGA